MITSIDTVSFYSAINIQENLSLNTDDVYMSVNFKKDSQSTIFERRSQNIYDLLAYIGGFWKAIFGIGFVMS